MDIVIDGGSARYLGEIPGLRGGLPHGVFNKVMPDVGGTYLAANCDSDYIIVCPFIDLVESIGSDSNNRYDVLKVYGDITKEEILEYCDSHDTHKIAVTYNSFKKLTDTLYGKYMLEDYKILIDEYHTILEDMDYREGAITSMMNVIRRFKHYTFLSATPIDEDYEIRFLEALPHYRVRWNRFRKVSPTRMRVDRLTMGINNLVRTFLDKGLRIPDINGDIRKVDELYIFFNSVEGIKDIIDNVNIKSDDVRICCANTSTNKKLLGSRYKIELASGKSKRINFFTKKCFQGCNMFTNNGLIIVVSDAHKSHTMIDISSTIEQIAGRLRYNDKYQNVFRNTLIHLYSTSMALVDDKVFEQEMKEKKMDANELLNIYRNTTSERGRMLYADRISGSLGNDLVSAYNGRVEYNPLKEKSFIFKYRLRREYSKTINVTGGDFMENSEEIKKIMDPILTFDKKDRKSMSVSAYIYRSRYREWVEGDDNILNECPEFLEYKKYLKESEMNSLFWNRDKIRKLLNDRKRMDELYDYVYYYYYKDDNDKGIFVSNKELKVVIAEGIKELGMGMAAKASLIDGCRWATKKKMNKDGKRLVGYLITKDNETGSKKKSKEG